MNSHHVRFLCCRDAYWCYSVRCYGNNKHDDLNNRHPPSEVWSPKIITEKI